MSSDYFMKIGDIKGESADDKHKEEIFVLSWSFGLDNPAHNRAAVSGGGAGRATVHDLSFQYYMDISYPYLSAACANGQHFKVANLVCRKQGKDPLEYLKLKLEDVLITNCIVQGVGGGDTGSSDARPTVVVSLNFVSYDAEYTQQKPDGSKGPSKKITHHIGKNSVVV